MFFFFYGNISAYILGIHNKMEVYKNLLPNKLAEIALTQILICPQELIVTLAQIFLKWQRYFILVNGFAQMFHNISKMIPTVISWHKRSTKLPSFPNPVLYSTFFFFQFWNLFYIVLEFYGQTRPSKSRSIKALQPSKVMRIK